MTETFEVEEVEGAQETNTPVGAASEKQVTYFYYGWQATLCLILSAMATMTSIFYLEVDNLEIMEGPPEGNVEGDPDLAVFVSLNALDREDLAQTSSLQTVLLFNILLPMIVAIAAVSLFPKARAQKTDFKIPAKRFYSWGLDLIVLAIFVVAGTTAVQSDEFQEERLAYCFVIFVMNTVLLWLAVFINKIETFEDEATRERTLFQQQTFMVIMNTVWTMGSQTLYHYPGVNPDLDDPDTSAWFGPLGFTGLGAETFVFFWLSFVTSSGLKLFVISPLSLLVSRFSEEKANKIRPATFYGSEELWASLLLNFAYMNVFAWLNNFTFIIGVGASIFFFIFGVIRKLCIPGYKARPSLIPYSVPNVLVCIPVLTIIFNFTVLLPRDTEYTVMCVATLLTYFLTLAVYLAIYFQDVVFSKHEPTEASELP